MAALPPSEGSEVILKPAPPVYRPTPPGEVYVLPADVPVFLGLSWKQILFLGLGAFLLFQISKR